MWEREQRNIGTMGDLQKQRDTKSLIDAHGSNKTRRGVPVEMESEKRMIDGPALKVISPSSALLLLLA